MAKKIQPVSVWVNGTITEAKYLQVTGIYDNYESTSTQFWQMFTMKIEMNGIDADTPVETIGEQVAAGNLVIDGASYVAWGDQPAMAINDWIYDWVAQQLNLTII